MIASNHKKSATFNKLQIDGSASKGFNWFHVTKDRDRNKINCSSKFLWYKRIAIRLI